MNICFHYFYRDAGNYKIFNNVVFSNPQNNKINELQQSIESALIDGKNFIAEKANIPTCYFDDINEDDHGWHEFYSIEETEDEVSDITNRTIIELIESLKYANLPVIKLLCEPNQGL